MAAPATIPISSLSPTTLPPAEAAIRAVVSLIWPYSSSTKQCALLLADPDIRLRNKQGQVRVRFSGPAAEAVALGKLGIGEEVLLELKGAKWVESNGGGEVVRTPGRSVDGELVYSGEVGLQKLEGGEWIRTNDQSKAPSTNGQGMQTPAATQNGGRVGALRAGAFGDVPVYSSPAFVRISRLSGDGFGDGYDPFTEDLEAEGPRKRARVSFGGVGKWRLATGRTPSPEKEDPTVQKPDDDVEMGEDVQEEQNGAIVQGEATPRVVDFATQTPAMAPPSSLPRLQVPSEVPNRTPDSQQIESEGPSTPNLKPVPSSTLPLPSPFPTEPPRADPIASETNTTPAVPALSISASASQPSLAFTQSLPDTAHPDDDDDDGEHSSPTGIYAHNGDIEGTYREHVPHPEWLSDTEEDEGLYDEHLRHMQEEAMRDEYGNDEDMGEGVEEEDAEEVIEDMGVEPESSEDEDEQGMEEVDVEEVIEDMGVEPEDSSEEEEDEEDLKEVKATTSNGPEVIEIEDYEAPKDTERPTRAEDPPQQKPIPALSQKASELEKAAAHQPEDDTLQPQKQVPALAPAKAASDIPSTTSLKRKAIPAPQTPAKLPAGIFGTDGASDTPQSTPQSERDRVMARTYNSLFGFSPAPTTPFVQTPTRVADMGRVETRTSGGLLRETLVGRDKAAGVQEPSREDDVVAEKKQADDSALPPRLGGEDVEAFARKHSQPATEKEVDEEREVEKVLEAREKQDAVAILQAPRREEDVEMADAAAAASQIESEIHGDAGQADAVEQPAEADNAFAALLEAAIEGDEDEDASAEEAAEDFSMVDQAMADTPEVVAPVEMPVVAAPAPPTQVEVIDLDDSSDEEAEAEAGEVVPEAEPEKPEAMLEDEPIHETSEMDAEDTNNVDEIDASQFPGSPTEVDSEEDAADEGESASDSMGRTVPETLSTGDARSIHPIDAEQPSRIQADKVIPETLQSQDAQSIQPDRSAEVAAIENSQAPASLPKSSRSFHYFSFQSTTSDGESLAGERQTLPPQAETGEKKAKTEVIELLSSSPAPEVEETQSIDAVVQTVGDGEHVVEDEQMEDVSDLSNTTVTRAAEEAMRSFGAESPDSTAVERMVREGEEALGLDGRDAGEASSVVHGDEQHSDAEAFSPHPPATQSVVNEQALSKLAVDAVVQASDVADDDDEHMSDAEAFSPELSVPQLASLDTHSRPPEVPDSLSYPTLPMSPDDSQSTHWETQLHPPAPHPNTNTNTFPPTPQLTQGDSLVKETQVVAEEAGFTPAALDPPARHTRSSVETTALDPPARHTRSSVEPTAVKVAKSKTLALDPPARHIRSSVEPAAVLDPPSRHTRSSAEPTAAGQKHVTPDPPARHTRSSVEEKALQSPIQQRKSTRRSQTLSQISIEPIKESTLEEEEAEDSIAVLSPEQKTPVRKSSRKNPSKDVEMDETHETPQKKMPSRKSLSSRLSTVPDVISAWFSPRRSTRLHPDDEGGEEEAEAEVKQPLSKGLSTPMGYYTPLSNLHQKMNSQARTENTVDIIAIVTDSTKAPERAKSGPKDYFTCFKIWDPSLATETSSVLVEVFRPWKATLPMAEVGDVILLRGFAVKSRKRQAYLISTDSSGWCVWRYAEVEGVGGKKGKKRALSFSGIREEIKGPPVELGKEERDRVEELRGIWEKGK